MTRILLVEDDKSIVVNLTEFLNNEGYAVKNVSSQDAAIELLANEGADLILLDVSLTQGNGFAVCRAVKAQYDIPVIFLTASGDEFSTVTGDYVNDNTLTVYIKRLREKIENDPAAPEIIKTVRGIGYKVEL